MNKIDDEILQMYIEESQEHLADIEPALLAIEKNGANIDEELVNKVFRAAHSIKGGSSFLGLTNIQEVSHKAENILEMIRSREMVPSPEVVNILLLAFDKLRDLINNHQESNNYDISEIMVSLTGLAASNLPEKQKESIINEVEIKVDGVATTLKVLEFDLNHAKNAGNNIYLVEFDLLHDIHRLGKTPISLFKKLYKKSTILQCVVDFMAVGTLDDEPINRLPLVMLIATKEPLATSGDLFEVPNEKIHLIYDPLVNQEQTEEHQDQTIEQIQAIAPVQTDEQAKNKKENIETDAPAKVSSSSSMQIETTLRVKVGLLETLMNLAGELVLSRNQLMEAITHNDQRSLKASAQQINLVASELQEAIMLTRMQTIDKIFNKFPRVVHDMGKKLNKKVQLLIEGKDVEMDKTIIEGLSDPLTHMVRNAVDHGLETSDIRAALGKNSIGTITLRAYHRAGHVVIEVCDDGKGLDPKKIAASAVDKGLISADDVKTLSEKEKMGLIFLPGLSTSEKITDVSGRGVGMDVVKTNLEKLGGKIDIESEPGKGSIFRIKLPLTLAIIPSLLVSVEQERFAIPQLNVNELIRIAASQVKNRIEKIGGAEVLNLRGSLIPLIHLANVLGISKTYLDPNDNQRKPDRRSAISDRRSKRYPATDEQSSKEQPRNEQSVAKEKIIDQKKSLPPRDRERRRGSDRRYHANSDLNIVVVTVETFQYGLIVDELHDTVEIVVKPLGQHLENAREYAGATIMGDGRVALILDVATIAEMEKLSSQSEHIRKREIDDEQNRKNLEESQSFMLFRNSIDEHCAILLDLVNRIEQIKAFDIEIVAGKKMIQYRGENLPLVTLSDVADVKSLDEGQNLVVIVSTIYGHKVGLLASRPIDIIETRVTIDQSTLKQKAIMGSSIINNHITMIVDIFELVERVYPEWVSKNIKSRPISDDAPSILLAEDSTFFRNQVKKFIEENGFNVFTAEDGQEAWDLLQKNADKICLVVTDIEMPRLDGFGLAANIKGDKRFSGLPVIAVTTLAGETDIEKGKSVGIDDYQIKLDKERLLESINNYTQYYRA